MFSLSYISLAQIEEQEIRKAMKLQEKCWNLGDIECFMDGYWKSEKLTFIGKNEITYGWEATLNRYKKKYPDREAMGNLTFEIVSVEPLGDHWFVVGKWNLERKRDTIGGHFSLIWRYIDGKWVITTDHTS